MAIDFAEMLTNAFGNAPILSNTLWGNSVSNYLIALGLAVLTFVVLKLFKVVVIRRLKKLATKTKTDIDDLLIGVIDKVRWPLFIALGLYIGVQFIQIPAFIETASFYAVILLATFYVVKALQSIIDYGTEKVVLKKQKEEKEVDKSAIDLLNKFLKISLWFVAIILLLSNLGFNISTLIAGLGIGGIAIAFALQNILSDMFSSFSIYFDRPFKIGDFIIIGDDLGIVKKIGIKSTRIQTLKGEELVVSNKELTETRVHNYGKMEKRRIDFTFGVTYQTPVKKLKKIPDIVRDIIGKIEMADIDRVHFKEYGDFSLNYEVVYYVKISDYNKYMDIQQEINLGIKEQFEKEGIEFAYPTQTIFLEKEK